MLYEQMYGGLYFEFYGLIFAFELLTGLIYFVVFQPRRNYFIMRACLSVAGYFLLVTATWAIFRAVNGGTPKYTVAFFFLVTIYLAIAVFCAFRTNVLGAIYYATGAYAVQHTAYSFGNILRALFSPEWLRWVDLIVFDFLIYVAVGAVFFMVFVWPRRKKFNTDIYDVRAFVISLVILLICILLSSRSDGIFAKYISDKVDIQYIRIYCSMYAIIGCVGAIVIQFGFLRENKLSDDNAILDQMIHNERKHHELTKETIDIINAKCHDLKHQIGMLAKVDDQEARKAYIQELKDCIAIYDTSAQTGNAALDIVISEKSLYCEKNNISLSCLADGKKLDFMSSTDIASLFGNAFDNAIENLLNEDESNRFISFSVKSKSGFVYVHMDNYCSDNPEFVDGLPQTTKNDKIHHGFGTKSIKSIVEKYSGEVVMWVEDERFNIDMIFPEA